jgi:chromosome partitioning protein
VLVVANQKGGVGKTTTAVNLGTAMAACDMRVLLVDLDPQGNASTGLGIPREEREFDSYAVLSGEVSMAAAITPSAVPGLFVIPSSENLSGAEVELVSIDKREYKLRESMVRYLETEQEPFYFIIIYFTP